MSAYYEEDVDSWAKESCRCGHARYAHEAGHGSCSHVRMKSQPPADLPTPIYDDENDPFEMPKNWPPVSEWPLVEVRCCSQFDDEPAFDGER